MVTLLSLMWTALASPGFLVESAYVSSYGPDAYGTLRLRADAGAGLEMGAVLLGGTRTAALWTTGRTLRITDDFRLRGEVQLGMLLRTGIDQFGGPTAGFTAGLSMLDEPVVVVVEGGYLHGVGWHGEGGVDASLSSRWTLSPRVMAETWAGDRDAALRVEMGARHTWRSRWFVSAALSAGGRDVVHMGPGFTLALGRSR